ncbi:MAG: 4Fe-4S dicluster domain-containing protein [Nitrospirota bacterium]
MTGERGFQEYSLLIPKKSFFNWIDNLRSAYRVLGPVKVRDQAVFKEVSSSADLFMEYLTTMLSPGKIFIYKAREDILKFRWERTLSIEEIKPEIEKQVIVGIHPCDTNAILYLDIHFQHAFVDPFYKARRNNTILIALNCTQVTKDCFCSSVGTGPFLKAKSGYDMLLTDFGEDYLVELKSPRIFEIFNLEGKKADADVWRLKSEKEETLIESFKKFIDIEGLDDLYMRNLDHPVWADTADRRCLSCSNCVMVCPTCFCYDVVEEMSVDIESGKMFRQLDACQDLKFAEVYGGNFRRIRASRLRQFQMHNLGYTAQYGLLKTVGCGRCITWCPTRIDLTEVAKEIQRSPIR